MAASNSGSSTGIRRRPVARISTDSGTGWGPATLNTPAIDSNPTGIRSTPTSTTFGRGSTSIVTVAPGIAEDEAEITAMGETLTVPAGEFTDTVRAVESSPLDAGTSLKIYVGTVGMAYDDGIELISY